LSVTASAADDFLDIQRTVDLSVVKVESLINGKKTSGAGCIIDDQCSIVTNLHVVDGAVSVTVHFKDAVESVACDLVSINADVDLVLVRPRDLKSLPVNWRPLQLAPATQKIEKGTKVLYVGHPKGKSPWTHHRSTVSNDSLIYSNSRFFQIQGDSPNGFSGAPVILENGSVVGVVCSSEDGGSVSMTFVVPHFYVHGLDRNRKVRRFDGTKNEVRLPKEISQSTVAYKSIETGTQSPIPDDVRSSNLGLASTDRIRQVVKLDQRGIPDHRDYSQVLGGYAKKAELIEFQNHHFGFGFVVQRGAELSEKHDPAVDQLSITVVEKDSPYKVQFVAERIRRDPFDDPIEGIANLERHSHRAFDRELGLNVFGAVDPITGEAVVIPGQQRTGKRGVDMFQVAGFGPLVSVEHQRAIWGFMYMPEVPGRTYVVTYAMNQDSFITAYTSYDPTQVSVKVPNPPANLLDSIAVATSLFQL